MWIGDRGDDVSFNDREHLKMNMQYAEVCSIIYSCFLLSSTTKKTNNTISQNISHRSASPCNTM
jgi:hypothetical protein